MGHFLRDLKPMLNADALSQLGALRQNLRANQPRLEGRVLPSRQRTGFVQTDAGARYQLSADDMQRLLPGDRICFTEVANAALPEAQLEALLQPQIVHCVGRLLVQKGQRWVQLDHAETQRRLPVSPGSLGAVAVNSWVHCQIERADDASPRARIDAVVAEPDAPFALHRVAMARHERATEFAAEVMAEVAALQPSTIPEDYADCTDLAWVTIDSPSTLDMDDAIHVMPNSVGWQVSVAIADASHWVAPGSELDSVAQQRYASQYLPGWTIPMLPEPLGIDRCALVPDQERGALVLQAQVTTEGLVASFGFQFARIKSHAKWSYSDVNQLLEVATSNNSQHEMLAAAAAVSAQLRQRRLRACLPTPDRPEYQLQVDDSGRMTGVVPMQRGVAEGLVEELMLLTNALAAQHLADHGCGLFLQHNGFKDERWPEVQQLLAPFFAESLTESLSYAQFQAILPQLQEADARLPVLLSRHYCRSELAQTPAPHWGLGLSCYTTVTSPIRRYLDLLLHRQLKAIWRGETIPKLEVNPGLADGHQTQREVERFLSRWLYADWMVAHVGETFSAQVQHLMPTGCLVLLDEFGCTGFVPLRAWQDEQARFDPVWMQHHLSFGSLQLGDAVRVKLLRVDADQRQMTFELQP